VRTPESVTGGRERRLAAAAALLLVAATVMVYLPAVGHDFVNYDDGDFVTGNLNLRAGLTWSGVRWAFTTFHASNWVPLTWISHLADVAFFDLQPWGHHLVSVVLHALNAALLFAVLRGATGAASRSLFVAALFALHPLHVESVAWVAERRDVLSTFFWLLALGAYVRYARCPAPARYGALVGLTALGLLAKPMLVTLPFVLLLLDYWPLGRLSAPGPAGRAGGAQASGVSLRLLLLEKVPLVALSAAAGVLTLRAQSAGGAVMDFEHYPFAVRFLNAPLALVTYLGKMLWPAGLAVFYPHPGAAVRLGPALLSLALLAVATLAALLLRRHPWLAAGWLWYLLTVAPVSGLVQVGSQAMADRYTYVPLIGVFIVAAWGLPALAPASRSRTSLLAAGAVAVVVALAAATRVQLAFWKDSVALMTRAIAVASASAGGALPRAAWILPSNLGMAWGAAGRYDKAEEALRLAIAANPGRAAPHGNLGTVYLETGRIEEAIAALREAVRLEPGDADARYNLGNACFKARRLEESAVLFREAVRLKPDYADAWHNLGSVALLLGQAEESRQALARAAELERGGLAATPEGH
jgi:tetratricopeptide (TPR) repeat protein